MKPVVSQQSSALTGSIRVPGDKSISHRALMFGAMAVGETKVTGLLEGEDVLCTAAAMRSLGASVEQCDDGTWVIKGRGVGGFSEPTGVLDMGNSGTAARLLMGVLATQSFTTFMTGDASLCSRPMERVMKPLRPIGVSFVSRENGRMPIAIQGTSAPMPISYELPVASAQVKSAVMLAGLNAPGKTTVIEPNPSRDHTEKMLQHFGAEVEVEETDKGGRVITLTGQPELVARDVIVPTDPSSAAFPVVAALITPGSKITVEAVGMNPLRTGLFATLKEMGGKITEENVRIDAGEEVADLVVEYSELTGVTVPASRAPSMIDEYPVLAVAASFAKGTTHMEGLEELRVKESDRLAVVVESLKACGVDVTEGEDFMIVNATGEAALGGGEIKSRLDHRIAMSFIVFGLASQKPVTIDDGSPIDTSFPGFIDLMNGLGAKIS
ncbi:3-phosphoshikimate 1-carboxyvinyltransferase [Candidatus Terasakiella magnetica]|uniref:3-phosphoshikimate 1-carboxyvinyltransferase n=1 Tax=Candidatus Terasakiella magnetica TaxID=1867952 RepID=A0A1C3RFT6_9PROT|nr:3-phosphoshikimate 1-carboxyvinyltransferase [Candidatus Terasakiella magnetica]SCA56118.1 3-phosphoshikimate 1-carboxyvinyltransferase [Candidatus Terasakiella magnetica]